MSKIDLNLERNWYKEAEKLLLNQKITGVVWQNWDESESHYGTGLVFETENETVFFVSQDDEGNGPGALHWASHKGHGILPVGVMDHKELTHHEIDELDKKRASK